MKANVRKLIGAAVIGWSLVANGIPARAGQKLLPEVTVGPSGASGSMVGAYSSPDSQQYIGCVFYETLTERFVSCTAKDKTAKSFTCSSLDPRWVTVVKAITDSSYISFQGSDGGACTSLVIENHSSHLR